jgi:replication-associated recombination protein RarA
MPTRTEQAVEIMRSMKGGVEDAAFYWAAIILEGAEAQRLLANLVWAANEKGWEGKAWDEAKDFFNGNWDLAHMSAET